MSCTFIFLKIQDCEDGASYILLHVVFIFSRC